MEFLFGCQKDSDEQNLRVMGTQGDSLSLERRDVFSVDAWNFGTYRILRFAGAEPTKAHEVIRAQYRSQFGEPLRVHAVQQRAGNGQETFPDFVELLRFQLLQCNRLESPAHNVLETSGPFRPEDKLHKRFWGQVIRPPESARLYPNSSHSRYLM